MRPIRIAIVGVGNCASSLLQGIEWYRRRSTDFATRDAVREEHLGLMNYEIGGYRPFDIEVVAAFDVDGRKVGLPVEEAIFSPPNNTMVLQRDLPATEVFVQMSPVLDGVAEHMADYPDRQTFVVADEPAVDVERVLRASGAEILLNYLPVGSEAATRFYAECALNTGTSFINCIPVFIVSDEGWGRRFAESGIPCVGDEIKAQVGTTITHRALARLMVERGARLDRTYQLNTGGNTDFLNMLNRDRLASKKISKTAAVASQLPYEMSPDDIHIGPSDFVPWQKDNKLCFLRLEGRGFAGFPVEMELRLSVEDSSNSAGCCVDAIRACKLARDRGIGGPLEDISAYLMKHPPRQMTDDHARRRVEAFVSHSPPTDLPSPDSDRVDLAHATA